MIVMSHELSSNCYSVSFTMLFINEVMRRHPRIHLILNSLIFVRTDEHKIEATTPSFIGGLFEKRHSNNTVGLRRDWLFTLISGDVKMLQLNLNTGAIHVGRNITATIERANLSMAYVWRLLIRILH